MLKYLCGHHWTSLVPGQAGPEITPTGPRGASRPANQGRWRGRKVPRLKPREFATKCSNDHECLDNVVLSIWFPAKMDDVWFANFRTSLASFREVWRKRLGKAVRGRIGQKKWEGQDFASFRFIFLEGSLLHMEGKCSTANLHKLFHQLFCK